MIHAASIDAIEQGMRALVESGRWRLVWHVERGQWDAYGAFDVDYVEARDDNGEVLVRVSPGRFECWISILRSAVPELSVDLGSAKLSEILEVVGTAIDTGPAKSGDGWILRVGRREIPLTGG